MQVWRLHGLIRLYAAYLLYTLSCALNTVKSRPTFEQWYMIYYHDLQLWEISPDGDGTIRTDLSANASNGGRSSLVSAVSCLGNTDSQVAEVANRVADIAKVTSVHAMACAC